MNSKHIVLSAIIGAVVVAVAGFGFYAIDMALSQKAAPVTLGSAQAYQAMNNQNLLTELQAINTDATNVRGAVTAVSATTSLSFGTLGVLGATTSTTSTFVTVAGAKFGDGAFCTDNSTSTFIDLNGTAQSGTILCYFANVSTTAQAVVTGTITAYDIPSATFYAPPALTQ